MSWFKVDDQFPRHPKVMRAGSDAAWLFVAGGCYCAQYLTDGMIPKDAVAGLTSLRNVAKLVQRLLEVDLWHDRGDEYEVHDYLVYNPTREKVLKDRAAAAERRAKGGRASRERRATDEGTSEASSPYPTDSDESVDSREPFEAEFDEVWYFWPKKLDRLGALAQYQARRRAGREQAEIMRAVVEYAEHYDGDLQFMPYLKTFIGTKGQWVEWLDGVPLDAVSNQELGVSAWKPEPPTLVPDPDPVHRKLDDEVEPCPLGECNGRGWVTPDGEPAHRCECKRSA